MSAHWTAVSTGVTAAMPDRNPLVNPYRGDELQSANGCRYLIVQVAVGSVRYRLIYPDGGSSPGSLTLSGWRDFADGLTVVRLGR